MDITDLELFRQVSMDVMAQLPDGAMEIVMHPWTQTLLLGEVRYQKHSTTKGSNFAIDEKSDHPLVREFNPSTGKIDIDYEEMEHNLEHAEDEILEEFPDYAEEWDHVDGIWMFLKLFRWIINLFLIAIPWTFLSQLMLIYNLWFNIVWNFMWAGGNAFLLINSIYLIQMTLHSVFLVTEVPFWMHFNKFGRWAMLILALIYNFLFLGVCVDFFLLLYVYDKSEYEFMSMFESMFFAYNIVLHFPITILNTVVILKEISLEFLQMSQKRHHQSDNLALGVSEWGELLEDALTLEQTTVDAGSNQVKRMWSQ